MDALAFQRFAGADVTGAMDGRDVVEEVLVAGERRTATTTALARRRRLRRRLPGTGTFMEECGFACFA